MPAIALLVKKRIRKLEIDISQVTVEQNVTARTSGVFNGDVAYKVLLSYVLGG